MKLLIRNLSRSSTEAEIRDLFETFGTVQSCTLVLDKETGISKGFGFIEMPRQGQAKAAMKNLNGKEIAGNLVRVKKAQPTQEKKTAAPGATEDPMHGVTLEMILTRLVEKHGWDKLGQLVNIKCFTNDPSIASCLKFLRSTAWAREKVEALYADSLAAETTSSKPETGKQRASVWPQPGDRRKK